MSDLISKAKFFLKKINTSITFSVVLVFIFFFGINLFIYFSVPGISSTDDQWFYFKMAERLGSGGWSTIINFKGAYFTDLVQSGFTYGMGLYHYFLVPFTFFSDKIFGLKLSGAFLASLVPAIIYWVFLKLNFKKSFLWILTFCYAISSFNFTARLFFNRNFILIDGLIILEMYLIFKRKYWAMFVASILHTWWHPATFWLPILLIVCFEAASLLNKKKIDLKIAIFTILGSLAGFLLFPKNSHTFLSPLDPVIFIKKIFSFIYGLGSGPQLVAGVENYKGDVFLLLAQNNVILIFLVFLIVFSVIFYVSRKNNGVDFDKDESRVILREFIFLVTIIIFLGFNFSRRFEDLLIPLVLFGSITVFGAVKDNNLFQVNKEDFKNVFMVVLFICLLIFTGDKILTIRKQFSDNNKFLKYERVGNWLKNNTKEGEIIFNTDFSQFPLLFFYDDRNNYIVGIEPKNLYEYSAEYYWLWHNISRNGFVCTDGDCSEKTNAVMSSESDKERGDTMRKNSKEIANIIKNKFKSQYVFFDKSTFLRDEMEMSADIYQLVYENKDDGTSVYMIK